MKIKVLGAVLALLIASACASTSSQMVATENRMRTIPVEYDRTFSAVASYIKERGFELMRSDRAKGVIETRYREGAGWGRAFTGDRRAKVIAHIRKIDPGSTQVILELISEVRDPYSGWQPVEMDVAQEQIYYSRFLEGIIARAEGRSIK